jgi:hypothetical protein
MQGIRFLLFNTNCVRTLSINGVVFGYGVVSSIFLGTADRYNEYLINVLKVMDL